MNKNKRVLSDIIVSDKYARYIPTLQRRENYEEIVDRVFNMHHEKFPDFKDTLDRIKPFVLSKKIAPSMRSMQFAGNAIKKDNNHMYNCAFQRMDKWENFGILFKLLLAGTGVGYSVQSHHVNQLPTIKNNTDEVAWITIEDSKEGWASALDSLMYWAFFESGCYPRFLYNEIRPKGSLIKTSGGKAPGPEPLKRALQQVEQIILNKPFNSKLTPLEVHDICCIVADCVLSGGIRRSAMISLFDLDDEEMLNCKSGHWWEKHLYRSRANNSAVFVRDLVSKENFNNYFQTLIDSNSGEPGIFWTNDTEIGTNPCAEISTYDSQFCNLTTVNCEAIESDKEYIEACEAAAILGTLQATYTDFTYLPERWKEVTEHQAIIGVSNTGIAGKKFSNKVLTEAAKKVVEANSTYAKQLGINEAWRTTTVKPEGTASLVFGGSSGIHAYFDDYYIRRITLQNDSDMYLFLKHLMPELIEQSSYREEESYIAIPLKAPKGAITRKNENAIEFLERVKEYYNAWVLPGHNKGVNTHNVSCTVNVKEEEWYEIREWAWKNKDFYAAISFLPYDGGTYKQAPFETITEEKYNELSQYIPNDFDINKLKELEDNTTLVDNLACVGDNCEII